MTKKIKKYFVCALLAGAAVFALAATPGGQDPLITLGFFRQEIALLTEQIREELRNELTAETQAENDYLAAALRTEIAALNHRLTLAELEFLEASGINAHVEQVYAGQLVIGGMGTRMILRGGTANAFSLVEHGLADLTAGTEIFDGQPVPLNHDLLVSRDDTRGLVITSEVAWVLIQGEYNVMPGY